MKSSGQSSVEYIALLGMLLFVVTVLFLQASQDVSSKIRDTKTITAVEKITDIVNEVYRLGPGSRLSVWIDVPPNIVESVVGYHEVGYRVIVPDAGITDVVKYVDANLTGVLPTEIGQKQVIVEMLDSGTIIIGCGIVMDPSSVIIRMNPGDSEVRQIQLSNACTHEFTGLNSGGKGDVQSWILVGSINSTLGTGSTDNLSVTITVPGSQAPGTYTANVYVKGDRVYSETVITIIVPDNEVPSAYGGGPTGTTNDNDPLLRVYSDEAATCRGSIGINEAYSSMDFTFSGTGIYHTYQTSVMSDGLKTVYVRCRDTSGNTMTTSYSWSFLVNASSTVSDSYPPNVNLDSPPDGNVSSTGNVTFQYTPEDAESGIQSCSLILNGVVNQTSLIIVEASINEFVLVNMPDGGYAWSINCTDDYNNVGSSETRSLSVGAAVDNPPTVTLNSPANGYSSSSSSVTFQYTPNDVEGTVASCRLILDGAVNQTDTVIEEAIINSFNVSGIANGGHTWSVSCTDNVAQVGTSETRAFNVSPVADNPPTVTLNSPANGYNSSSSSVTFQYTPNDVEGTVASCRLILNSAVDQTDVTITEGAINEFTKTGLANGPYSWSVSCTDDSSNVGTSSTRNLTVSVGSTTIAYDGFEGGWTGGTGWLGSWTHTGQSSLETTGAPYAGSYHLKLVKNGDSQRSFDASSATNLHARFWAKVSGYESGDHSTFQVSSDGAAWNTVRTWTVTDSDNVYHYYDLDLSGYTTSATFWVRFNSPVNGKDDILYVDEVYLVNV